MIIFLGRFRNDDFEAEDIVEEIPLALHGEPFNGNIAHPFEIELDLVPEYLDREIPDSLGVRSTDSGSRHGADVVRNADDILQPGK